MMTCRNGVFEGSYSPPVVIPSCRTCQAYLECLYECDLKGGGRNYEPFCDYAAGQRRFAIEIDGNTVSEYKTLHDAIRCADKIWNGMAPMERRERFFAVIDSFNGPFGELCCVWIDE